MNMPAKVCLGAGAFLVMSGGLLAITGFAMGAQTHLDLDWGRAHKSEPPVDTGAPHVEAGPALPAFSRRGLRNFPDQLGRNSVGV